jgi:hypothetical protein
MPENFLSDLSFPVKKGKDDVEWEYLKEDGNSVDSSL